MNPFLIELIVLRKGAYDAAEQRALGRDVERVLLVRVRRGVFVERSASEGLTPEGRHVVAMRALAAVSSREPVFSHWSAAVALGLTILDRARLERVHLVMPERARRGNEGAAVHLREVVPGELGRVGSSRGSSRPTAHCTPAPVARRSRPHWTSVGLAEATDRGSSRRATSGTRTDGSPARSTG